MCQGAVAPCTNPAPAPTAISIPAGPFANGEAFEVSCTATEDGTTFYIWTVPAGLSITTGTGTKTIRVSGTANPYNKSEFTVYAVNPCGTSAAVDGGTGTIVVNAVLGTTPPPSTDIEIPSGSNTGLDGGTVSGGNCASYSYQWQVFNSPNWEDIPGATNETYQTPNLTADTRYRRITTCGSETVTSPTITVTIKQVTEPGSVNASSTTICSGTPTTLSYTGGSGTTFVWYSGSCGGTELGRGNNLQVSPTATTTYYGRWESGSSVSDCKSQIVTVNTVPATPGTMTLSATSINIGSTFTASISAVSGATGYVWTLPSGLTGTSTTQSITITAAAVGTYNQGTITVAARNNCGTSAAKGSTSAVVVGTFCEGAITKNGAYNEYEFHSGLEGPWSANWTSGFTAKNKDLCWAKNDVGMYRWFDIEVCPVNWRVPNLREFHELYKAMGGNGGTAKDFTSLLPPHSNPGTATGMTDLYPYWSSTDEYPGRAPYWFYFRTGERGIVSYSNYTYMVRCVREL
jgi:hypothetical protein